MGRLGGAAVGGIGVTCFRYTTANSELDKSCERMRIQCEESLKNNSGTVLEEQ
jgi:hypothetical protein